MSKSIRYSFLKSATAGKSTFIDFDLNYGTITSVGQQVVYSGTADSDGIFVRPGLTYDLTGAAGSSDSIYFTGNYSDYTRTLMDGSTWEISRMVNGQTTESVKVLKLTGLTADRLVFADGAIFSHQVASTGTANLNSAVKSTDPSIGQGNYSGAEAKASTPHVAAVNGVGVTFFTLRPGIKLTISGSAGIDTVYVADGSTVDATTLGGGTDRIYLRGTWAEYTKSVVNSNLVLTRTVGGATEKVTVLPGSAFNADKLIFADGSISTFNASKNLGVTNPVLNTAEKTPLLSDAQVVAKIVAYAQNNGGTEGQTPTLAELAQLGITGVGGTNGDGTSQPTLAMILSALADTEVTGAQANTKALIQGIVDAYAAIVQSADGVANNDVDNPTGDDYSKIGVSGVDTPQEVSLLGDVLDTASIKGVSTNATAVDTVSKIQALGDAVQAVMDGQATREQLESLGVTGATDAKIEAIKAALRLASDTTQLNTLEGLQAIVSQAMATNDLPTLGATPITAAYANNGHKQTLFRAASASPVDKGQTITGLTFTVSNLDGTSNEKFTVDGTEFSLTDGASGTTTANSVGYSVSITGSTATVTLTMAAGLSAAQTQTLVEGLAYKHAISGGMAGDRVVTLTEITDSGSDNNVRNNLALASTVLDKTAPLAIDLTSAAGTQATESQFYNASNAAAGKAVFANIQASDNTDIASIKITVAGTADTSNDKWLLVGTNTVTIDLNTTVQTGTETIGGVAVSWSYNTSKELTISKAGGGAFTSAQAQAIAQALQFQTAASATQGDRSFTISHTDLSGNTGTSATETVSVDTTAPTFNSAPTASLTQSSVATTDVIYTALAQDQDTKSIAYTITGTDSGLFNISAGGAVTFKTTQAASTKSDTGADGTYNFDITATDAAGNARTQAVAFTLSAPQPVAGQPTIDLGSTNGTPNGQLIKGVQVEGKWYYHWDRSNDGTSGGEDWVIYDVYQHVTQWSIVSITYGKSGGADWINHDVLDGIFNQDINGTAGGGGNTNDTYRYATINGLKVALPTSKEMLTIWDSQKEAGTSGSVSGVPLGWQAHYYWSATAAQWGHLTVHLNLGFAADEFDFVGAFAGSRHHVALQVLNPATFTGTSYERATNTFKLTGTDMSSLGTVGTDIKGFINWTKFGYDTNADGVADVTFAQGDIASAKVTSDTGLEVVLGSAKATALETADGFDSTSAAVGNADKLILATNAANAYSYAANLAVTQAVLVAGDPTINLGSTNGIPLGQLILPTQVESKWYYYLDRSMDGSSARNSSDVYTDGFRHEELDSVFTQNIYGETNPVVYSDGRRDTTDTYRYATVNGVRLALPRAGAEANGSSYTDQANTGGGTQATDSSWPNFVAIGGSRAIDATPNSNPSYDDWGAICAAHNNGVGSFAVPSGWSTGNNYWSSTAHSSFQNHHMVAVAFNGSITLDGDNSSRGVALQVLAPTTLTAASYSRAVDTFTVTGTALDSAGNVGDDIKDYLDWSKFGYDTDGDKRIDVTFNKDEIASARVVNATQLNIVLNTTKATALEGLTHFDSTTAAVNGADKVITQKGFTDTVLINGGPTRDAWQTQDAASLGVTQSLAGQSVIDLGSTYGKLIAPVQVEGKWYYHWDRSGDGTSDNATAAGQTPINGGVDWTTHVVLDDIFKYDINGIINPVAGTDTTDTFRYATLNGVKVALPTYGARLDSSGKAEPPQGLETFQNGTAASNTTTDNPLYNDLLAIWDAHNGAGTLPNGVSGVPTGWQFNNYYSATLSSSGHAHVAMNNGYVGSTSDANHNVCFVALQVL